MADLVNGLRTYRPNLDHYVFCSELVQNQVNAWIEGALSKKSTRALLLTGSPGLGKTTLALAACQKLNANPRDINQVNCANYRKIDETRELLLQLAFMPMHGDYRALILDEVHQLTKDSQQAFMTPLEEDLPKQTLVIACTSKPEELETAFRRRFYEIKLQPYTPEEIADILMQLPVTPPVKPPVAASIATHCGGNPAKAIAMVEQNFTGTPEAQEALIQSLKQDEEAILAFYQALFTGSSKQRLLLTKTIKEENRKLFFDKIILYLECSWMILKGLNPAISTRELQVINETIKAVREDSHSMNRMAALHSQFLELSEKPSWTHLKSWIMLDAEIKPK